MKVTRIPGTEATTKHSFSFRNSTTDLLTAYQKAYERKYGVEVTLKDLVEQMLLDFMVDDKDFQRDLKQPSTTETRGARKGSMPAGTGSTGSGDSATGAASNSET